jgi:hypothetical protein
MVIKRTKVLRGMVPGGELLDGVSLLCEVMDKYIRSLCSGRRDTRCSEGLTTYLGPVRSDGAPAVRADADVSCTRDAQAIHTESDTN